jgi:hypothetical protein
MIYLSHWCYLHNAFFQFSQIKIPHGNWTVDGFPSVMQHLLQAASAMYSPAIEGGNTEIASQIAGRICQGLSYWAAKYDFNLPIIVEATWLAVKKRDWNKHPDGIVECPRCHGDGCDYCNQIGKVKV